MLNQHLFSSSDRHAASHTLLRCWLAEMAAEDARFLYEPGKFQVTGEMKQHFEKDGYIIVR